VRGPRYALVGTVTRVRQSSPSAVSPDVARRYVQRLARDGVIDFEMSKFQMAAIDAAVRSGRPILLVEDLDHAERERHLTHAT
jgi:hypothetical protein